jgi:hypothetical protein
MIVSSVGSTTTPTTRTTATTNTMYHDVVKVEEDNNQAEHLHSISLEYSRMRIDYAYRIAQKSYCFPVLAQS